MSSVTRAPAPVLPAALLVALLACAACDGTDPSGPPPDDEGAAFLVGKADGACLAATDGPDARGVLQLANDPALDADALDATTGLDRRAAAGIVRARPIADLAALDRVSWVGPRACAALRREACVARGLCEPELEVWSWNIEHFPLTVGAIDEVAGALVDHRVELVGFQEVDDLAAFDTLLAGLPGWAGLPGQTGFDTQVALAYDTRRLRVVAVEDLFPDDSYRFPRPPLAVTLEVVGAVGRRQLTVVVVHLKAQVDAASQERRRQAAVALEAWMAAHDGDAVLALGDWNDDIDDAPADNIFRPFLDRPARYAPLSAPLAARGAYSYLPFRRLIDHVIATRPAAEGFPAAAVDAVALDGEIADYARRVSDHRPVAARLVPVVPAD